MKYFQLVPILLVLAATARAAEPAADDISDELGRLIANTRVPSLAAAVVLDGRVVAAGAQGVRKQGEAAAVTLDDKYHIGSCTKSMTATLAAILVAEGKIDWETTVNDAFPDVVIHEHYKRATLRQLLSHTAGCPGDINPLLWAQLWNAKGTPSQQRMQLLTAVLAAPPKRKPGEGFEYSNAGVAIAGVMLEKSAGAAYESLLRDKLFVPLKMDSAGFRAPATNGLIDQPYGHNPRPVNPEPGGDNPAAIAPAGAVHCSILDLAKYASFHLNEKSQKLLPAEEFARLHQPAPNADGYALGWKVVERPWAGGTALTHMGSNTMFTAVIWLAPKRNFAVVAACNLGIPEGIKDCDAGVGKLIPTYLPK